MPSFEKHCSDCVAILGKPFDEVHLWLDEYFRDFGPHHRDIRHHAAAIMKVRDTWGEEAAMAAEIHIQADCGEIPKLSDAYLWAAVSPAIPGSTKPTALEKLMEEFPQDSMGP